MTTTETLQIEGMSCDHCVRAVRDALDRLDGVHVESVRIDAAMRLLHDGHSVTATAQPRAPSLVTTTSSSMRMPMP